MHDPITVILPSSDEQLTSGSFQDILYDFHSGKDFHYPYPAIPSPIGSDEPHFSAGASTMSGSSTSPPSLCGHPDEYTINPAHTSTLPPSYASDDRRPLLTPLSITHGPRYGSPWSSVDAPSAYTNLRRGSLPAVSLDHTLQNSRPFTAPQEHAYTQQSSWSDQDDLSRFAYSGYDSPVEEPPMSAFSATFSPAAPSPRHPGFLMGSSRLDDEFSRSRPSTRGEYPAYIPDCQETIHADTSQQYLVDPNAVYRQPDSIPSPPESKPQIDHFLQPSGADTSRTITPSSPIKRKRSLQKEKSRASPIIETFKDGIVPPIKRRGKLPKATTELLKCWLYEHAQHPYPTEEEKRRLCAVTGLTFNQVSNWMINARRRILPARNAAGSASQGCSKLSPHSGGCNLPSSSGSLNEHYQSTDPSISGHPPQNAASSSAWEHQPSSISPHPSPPTAFYTNQHLQPYTTSSADPSAQSGSLVGCVTTSQFLPYGLGGGGNPFNYHGSTDANILSRTFIDSKQFLDHSYPSALDRTQMLKREQAVEPTL